MTEAVNEEHFLLNVKPEGLDARLRQLLSTDEARRHARMHASAALLYRGAQTA